MSLATFPGADSRCLLTFVVGTHALGREKTSSLSRGTLGARAAAIEGKLIHQHNRYDWIDHEKIRHGSELHKVD